MCACVWMFVPSECVLEMLHISVICLVCFVLLTSVSESSWAACGCKLGCLPFVHGSVCVCVCRYNCAC